MDDTSNAQICICSNLKKLRTDEPHPIFMVLIKKKVCTHPHPAIHNHSCHNPPLHQTKAIISQDHKHRSQTHQSCSMIQVYFSTLRMITFMTSFLMLIKQMLPLMPLLILKLLSKNKTSLIQIHQKNRVHIHQERD